MTALVPSPRVSDPINITLPDGSSREYESGVTPAVIAALIGSRLAKATLAAKVDGEWSDADRPIERDATVELITADSPGGREVLRHSTAHVMAQAVLDLFPGSKYAIGPAISDGFYYDFELPGGAHFTEDDLARIDEKMREIVKADERFEREDVDFDEALKVFADQPYKREIIERVRSGSGSEEDDSEAAGGGNVSLYRNTHDGHVDFVDLCRGPHVPSTGRLGAFKLTRVAGAYWRGNEKGPQLQRVYGTAWESEKALAEHLHRIEEAERRDHRRLGVELDLFSFPEEIGSGLAVFHPKGGTVRRIMEDYSRHRHEQGGYEFVNSPHITKSQLFETSGHLQWFAEGMFPPIELDGGTDYYLKPMNCPFHCLIFRSRTRSYRELPLRLFEFGTVYRYEMSGVVHGLTRDAWLHARRRAHLLLEGADGRGIALPARVRARSAARLRPRRLLPRTVDQARGQGGGQRRGMGGSHRSPALGGRAHGPRIRHGPGRRRVLRAEDLGADASMRSGARGRCRRSNSTSRRRSASGCTMSAPITSGTNRS